MKKVVLLGSTGSVGTSTCKVAEDLSDEIQLIGLAAGRNVSLLRKQVEQFNPKVKKRPGQSGEKIKFFIGIGLCT